MSHLPNWWLLGAALGVAMIVQWVLLRAKFRSEIFEQRARHQQHQQGVGQQLEQAKRQIGKLQLELARARVQLERHAAAKPVPPATRPKLAAVPRSAPVADAAGASALPKDGFADTLPTSQFPHDVNLLRR